MRRRDVLRALVALPIVPLLVGRLPEPLTREEKEVLAYAATVLHEGCAGATFESSREPGNPFYDSWRMREGLRQRGLLRWTAQDPEMMYPGNVDGWYTITDRGRRVIGRHDCKAIVRAAEEAQAERVRRLQHGVAVA
jgi:hypothetical protein